MGWASPLSELTDPGEVDVAGIDAVANVAESHLGRRVRPPGAGRRNRLPHSPRQGQEDKGVSPTDVLSDAVAKEGAVQRRGSHDIELKPSSPDQFVSAEYFPASPGQTWVYLANGSQTANVKTLPESAIVDGTETRIAVNSKTGVSICYTSNNNGILIHRELVPKVNIRGVGATDLLVSFIPPIQLADGLVELDQTAYSIGIAILSQGLRCGLHSQLHVNLLCEACRSRRRL
jgi:hypothetical protein